MKNKLMKIYVALQALRQENGQDLIEYALVVALIAFAATVGMGSVASSINSAFVQVGTDLGKYVS